MNVFGASLILINFAIYSVVSIQFLEHNYNGFIGTIQFVLFEVFLFGAFYITDKDFKPNNKPSKYIFIIPIISIISILICFSFRFSDSENYKEQVYEKPIYGLNLKNDKQGFFILGTGTINNKLKYYYYIKDEENMISIDELDADSVKINMDDSKTPSISLIDNKKTRSYYFLIIPLFSEDIIIDNKKIITIPSNSIKEEYKLN